MQIIIDIAHDLPAPIVVSCYRIACKLNRGLRIVCRRERDRASVAYFFANDMGSRMYSNDCDAINIACDKTITQLRIHDATVALTATCTWWLSIIHTE